MSIAHERLIRKLQSATGLTAEEEAAVRGLPLTITRIEARTEVLREGDRPSDCCLVVDGLLVREKIMPHGGRQIMSVHVPGDVPDLQSLHLEVMDHALGTVAPSTIALIPHAPLRDLVRRYPGIATALWRETLVDAAIYREWLANIGRRSAFRRAAHLLCEFFFKMQAVGLTEGDQVEFPLTQEDLGDAMGLSTVHVNRTLQQLRAACLIILKGKSLTIPDFSALESAGGFDPTYLHLKQNAAA